MTTAEAGMGDTAEELDEVIGEVLSAEQDDIDELPVDAPDADEISEEEVCGSLDGFTEDELLPPIEEGLGADTDLVVVSKLDGVPLFYARGVPPRPTSFQVEAGFRGVLVATVKSVKHRAPASFGELTRITSAGARVDKPGAHGSGRAFDHDRWTFEHVDIKPIKRDHAASSLAVRRRYWALAAIMRSQCSFVLHGRYNAPHEDHIHQDNSGAFGFQTGSEATVKLVQAICNDIYRGTSSVLAIDGGFGDLSRAAVKAAMQKVDLPGDINDRAQFKRFLLRSGALGFKLGAP